MNSLQKEDILKEKTILYFSFSILIYSSKGIDDI